MFDELLGEVKGFFNTITLIEMVIAIIYIIVGMVLFTNSSMSNTAISIITGMLLICSGIVSILSFLKRGDIVLFNFNLVYGFMLIILGIIAFFLGDVLKIALGIYLLIMGFQKINYGILLRKFNESSWLFTLVVGIALIVLGIITFLTSGESIVKVAGICIIGYGAIDFVSILLLRKRSKYFIA